jgi:hypothetical protein
LPGIDVEPSGRAEQARRGLGQHRLRLYQGA